MERAIRLGKDFNVRWSIRKVVDGERQPYELAGKELVLQYRRPNGTLHEAKEWRVDGNFIIWTFRGRDQKAPGSYGLILTENGGKDGMVTVDTCRAFKLVEHSCEETEGSGSDIVIEDVVLESEVAFAPIVIEGGGGGSYDDTEIKEDIAALQAKDKATDAQLAELSEENERLKERIEEQDVFIEDLEYHKLTANSDNRYPDISVGTADNLAGVDVVDSEINFRRSGGGAISDGVARIESIKGNSVVWNEIFKAYDSNVGTKVVNGVTFSLASDGSVTAQGTAEGSSAVFILASKTLTANHKYIIIAPSINSQWGTTALYFNGYTTEGNMSIVYNGWAVFAATSTQTSNLVLTCWAGKTVAAKTKVAICDLTHMFGSGNEPTTIEEFYSRIPMGVDLNAYNEGEVIHMSVQSIESQGVNAWDEEIEMGVLFSDGSIDPVNTRITTSFIPVIPNKTYYQFSPNSAYNGRIAVYDENKVAIYVDLANGVAFASKTFTTPSNAKYMRITFGTAYGTTYNHDICINLSDTSINGKYFPYIKRVEDLSIIRKYFPQGMKSAGSAHDAIRYNKESGKWEKVEAIGIRAYQEGDADNAAYLTDGKVTCYPLAEPVITELDEADQFKDLDYQVWNAGTEKAIAEGKSSALAADITYGFNAIGKIKELESLVAALRAKVGI